MDSATLAVPTGPVPVETGLRTKQPSQLAPIPHRPCAGGKGFGNWRQFRCLMVPHVVAKAVHHRHGAGGLFLFGGCYLLFFCSCDVSS